MKCGDVTEKRCKCCGSYVTQACGKRAAYVVFYDEGDPVGYCTDHKDNMGEGWLGGRIEWKDVRRSQDGRWKVRVDGKWYFENSEEYCDLKAAMYGLK